MKRTDSDDDLVSPSRFKSRPIAETDVVLLSGGIDSLVCAEMSREVGALLGCVFVDYGHPAQAREGWKAFAYCGEHNIDIKVVHVHGLDLGDMSAEANARVVPCRNAVLLSVAANAAKAMGGAMLVIGANADDQKEYADCRSDFISRMTWALDISIKAPLLGMRKGHVIGQARRLGLKRSDAWSCYGPVECGECPSCLSADAAWGSL